MEAICEIYSRMPFAFQTELPPLRGSFTKQVRMLGQSLHSISRTQTKCFVHFVRLCVEKGQFTFDISTNVLLAKRLGPNVLHFPNEMQCKTFGAK